MRTFLKAALIAATLLGSTVTATEPALAADRRLIIDNQTDDSVYHMYISNAGTNSWGPDQLGDDTLAPHTYIVWNIDDGSGYCIFDFKFVMDDGSVKTKNRYNVCSQSRLNVVDW